MKFLSVIIEPIEVAAQIGARPAEVSANIAERLPTATADKQLAGLLWEYRRAAASRLEYSTAAPSDIGRVPRAAFHGEPATTNARSRLRRGRAVRVERKTAIQAMSRNEL